VTQLALLLALSLIGVVLSFGFGRLEVKRVAVSGTIKRAEGALERASVAVLRLGALRSLGLLAVPALGLSAFALTGGAAGSVPALGKAAFMVVALLAGAASALVQARFTLGLGARAASSAAASVARGSARAMRPLLRSAVAVAVFGEGLGLLGVAAAFASLYAVRGGFAAAGESPALAAEVVKLLPAYALGAAITVLSLSRLGSVAATAAQVGSSPPAGLEVGIEPGDARDPALLAELVGHLVGELLPRALTSYVCGLCATVSVALLSVSGAGGSSLAGAAGTSSLVLVILIRAFGAIGSVCGVLAARVSDDEAPLRALFRGQASAIGVGVFGLGAGLFWLERPHLGPLFVSGVLGLLAMSLSAQLSGLPLRRRPGSARELSEARGSGQAATIARGASSGLASLGPALLVPVLMLVLVERLLSPHAPSGLLLLTFAAGALSLSPLSLSIASFGLLTTHSRGLAVLARLELEPQRRQGSLDEAGVLGNAAGGAHASLTLALSALLGLLSLTFGSASPSALGLSALGTTLGITLILLFGARSTRSAVLGSRLVGGEVERQLREAHRPSGAGAPADFTPSYKACVEAALNAAQGASSLEAAALLVAPFALGLLLHVSGGPTSFGPLASFGISAVLAGLVCALGARATRAVLGELRLRLRNLEPSPTSTATETRAFGELVGVTAATSVEALALVLALTVICLAPLLR
jgi:Na+/H+-translocating membrane pyrophosphatase